jgi:hypothetical protein
VPERRGLGARLVWPTQPAEPPIPDTGCIAQASDRLNITEVRIDTTSLYLDVVHRAATPVTAYRDEAVTAELLLNMCPAPPPPISGRVWEGWPSPSTVTIALSDLPDGELDLMLRAFGQQRTIPLRKAGARVTYLPIEQRAGYRYQPGDPATGREPSASLDEYHCPGEVVP